MFFLTILKITSSVKIEGLGAERIADFSLFMRCADKHSEYLKPYL